MNKELKRMIKEFQSCCKALKEKEIDIIDKPKIELYHGFIKVLFDETYEYLYRFKDDTKQFKNLERFIENTEKEFSKLINDKEKLLENKNKIA